MPAPKRNPPSEGADGGLQVQVKHLRGRSNYTKLKEAVQPVIDMGYDFEIYKKRTQIDDWFSVFGLVVLSKAEYFVLRFILARTVHYGKACEIILKSHFLDGVQAGGEWKTAPCGVNSRDLYSALASLTEKGFITPVKIIDGRRHLATAYGVNIAEIISTREKPDMASKLKLSKKYLATVVPNGTTPPAEPRCQMAPKNSIQIKANNDDGGRAAKAVVRKSRIRQKVEIDCNEKAEEVVARVVARARTKLEEKVRRGRAAAPGAISLTDLNATWKRCMLEHSSATSVIGLTHKEYGIFKKVIKPHDINFSWQDFFTWVIQNWRRINESHAEYLDYKKRSGKGWSMNDGENIYLGTRNPDLSVVVKRFSMLVRRYLDRNTVSIATVKEQKKEQAQPKSKREAVLSLYEEKQRRAAEDDARRREEFLKKPKVVPLIRSVDEFDDDEELPEWEEQA